MHILDSPHSRRSNSNNSCTLNRNRNSAYNSRYKNNINNNINNNNNIDNNNNNQMDKIMFGLMDNFVKDMDKLKEIMCREGIKGISGQIIKQNNK